MVKIVCKKWKETSVEKFHSAEQFRTEDKFCDITLESVDKVKVRAHKIILVTGSPYFNDLFSSGMKEALQDCIEYKLIKGDILEKVISFIYTGELEVLEAEKIEEIAVCANYFRIKGLIDECMKFLGELLNDSNCLKYWRLSNECFHQEIEDQCISHLFNSPSRIYENESFFNELNSEEVERLLKDDRLRWAEEKKVERILQWVKQNTGTKEEFGATITKFIEFIDFASINKMAVSNVFSNDDLLEHKDVIKIIAKKYNEEPKRMRKLMETEKVLLAIIDDELKTFSKDGNVAFLQRKENSLKFTAETAFNNSLFICGGESPDSSGYANICEYFDGCQKEWKILPPMPTSRRRHSCTFLEDWVYACGGYNNGDISTVEIFDIHLEKWKTVQNMKKARHEFGLATANRSLYAVSGWNVKNIERFDIRAGDGWTEAYSDLTSAGYTQCVSVGSDIHCFQRENNKPFTFDTKMNKIREWKGEGNYVTIKEGYFRICVLNETINFLQCNNVDSDYIDFYKYNTEGNLIMSMPKILHSNKAAVRGFVALNL